jgi:hypothetical protein
MTKFVPDGEMAMVQADSAAFEVQFPTESIVAQLVGPFPPSVVEVQFAWNHKENVPESRLMFGSPSSITLKLRNAGQFVSTLRAVLTSLAHPGAVFKLVKPSGASPNTSGQSGCAKIQWFKGNGGSGGGPDWQNAGFIVAMKVANTAAISLSEWFSMFLIFFLGAPWAGLKL